MTGAGPARPVDRVWALLDAQRPAEALTDGRRALAAAPHDVELLLAVSAAECSLGRKEAVATAQRAVAALPTHPAPYVGLGRAHRFVGRDANAAVDAFTRALQLGPGDIAALTERAEVYLDMTPPPSATGRDEVNRRRIMLARARRDADAVLAAAPARAEAHVLDGHVHYWSGSMLEARLAADRALRIDPANADALRLRGLALGVSGQLRHAGDALLAAGRLDPRRAISMRTLRRFARVRTRRPRRLAVLVIAGAAVAGVRGWDLVGVVAWCAGGVVAWATLMSAWRWSKVSVEARRALRRERRMERGLRRRSAGGA